MTFYSKRDHRSYAEVLHNKVAKQNEGHIGAQKEACHISLKRDTLYKSSNQDLGLNKVVKSQNGLKRSGSVLCHKFGSNKVNNVQNGFKRSGFAFCHNFGSNKMVNSKNGFKK